MCVKERERERKDPIEPLFGSETKCRDNVTQRTNEQATKNLDIDEPFLSSLSLSKLLIIVVENFLLRSEKCAALRANE